MLGSSALGDTPLGSMRPTVPTIIANMGVTLNGSTVASTSTVTTHADFSQSVSASVASVAQFAVTCTFSVTLGAVTFSSLVGAWLTGTFSKTLGALTLASDGTKDHAIIANQTLGALTLSTAGTVAVKGQFANTLGATSINGTAAIKVQGTFSSTLGAYTDRGYLKAYRRRSSLLIRQRKP